MSNFIIKELNPNVILNELHEIGFDETYLSVAQNKFKYKNLKIFDLTSAQANILKQTALSIGADCATHKSVITGSIEKSNAILGGSYSQLKKIAQKLQGQPFKLSELGNIINNTIDIKKQKTKIAGILNVTPDSFSDGGMYLKSEYAIKHLQEMIEDGADVIDIGAESTRPNAEDISAKEQIRRLKPILEFINKENISIPISVDTRNSEVADFALNMGVAIINDVSGFDYDNNMPDIISKYKSGVIIQHSKGTPKTMQNNPNYNNLMDEVYLSLQTKINLAREHGIEKIIVDPGIGFGKTAEQNFEIINRTEELYSLGYPVMVGISRKSLLGVNNNDNSLKDTLSLAISYPLILKKVDYLRVHNVKLHKRILELG